MTESTDKPPAKEGEDFWRVADPDALQPPILSNTPSALERLGAAPFPKSRFPFLGFLATVYDHVAAHVGSAGNSDQPGDIQQ